MKKILHFPPQIIILCVIIIIAGCSKKKSSPQISAGVGTYTFNGTNMYTTNDTLTTDFFSGGKDVTMWPTASASAQNLIFVYNIPSQSSGSVNLSDGSSQSSTAPYILGYNGQIHFASVAGSGSVTKTGVTSFSFSCKVSDDSNPGNTYTLSGSGTY